MVMNLLQKLAYCLAVAVPVAALAACSSSTTASTSVGAMAASGPPPEQSSITVEAVPTADEVGLYIAADEGLFAKQGLHVNIVPTSGGELTLGDLNAGKAQLVAGNYVSFIQFQVAHKANLRIIANGSLMQPGNQAVYVMPNSPLHTVADLARYHASIGVNTTNNVGNVLIGSLLQSQGASLSSVSLVAPPKAFVDEMRMLKSGQLSAAWLPEPFGTIAEQEFGAVRLTDLDQGALTNFPIGCYIGTAAWVQAHPNTVAAFLRAFEKGQQIADTNRAAVETALEKHTGVPPLIADTMTINNYPLYMDVPEMQRVSDAMFEFRVMPPSYAANKPYQITGMIQPQPGMVAMSSNGG
jgi:NitT/TauT family transport system substrate-binding protein